jgi:hypothetical protein
MEQKKCCFCKQVKDVDQFYTNGARGPKSRCKICYSIGQQAEYATRSGKARRDAAHNRWLNANREAWNLSQKLRARRYAAEKKIK